MARTFTIIVRTAVEGLKAEVWISKSLIQEIAQNPNGWGGGDGEAGLIAELHVKGNGAAMEYRLVDVSVVPSNDDIRADIPRAPDYDDHVGLNWHNMVDEDAGDS